MTTLAFDTSTALVLWRRDLLRFFRQPTRIIGALGQPVIFWLVIGAGMASTFTLPGTDLGYMEFFFPGVVMMVLLFASIFSTVSVIEDRQHGFLQAVMAGPGSRASLVLGKCIGSSSVALIQASLFLMLMPLAGFGFGQVHWPLLLATLVLTSLGLTAFGFAVAWLLDNLQAYHALQMTLLLPLWLISGAMFPAAPGNDVFAVAMAVNPMAYAVAAARHAMYGGLAPAGTTLWASPIADLAVVTLFAAAATGVAVAVCSRTRAQ